MKYAGLWPRFFALLLDFIILSCFFFPATYLYKGVWLMQPGDHLWIIFDPICAVFLFIIFAYFILLEGWLGFTAGKLILGLRVLDTKGGSIGIKQSIIRNLLRLVDGAPLNIPGIVLIIRSPLNQRFGDRIAHTVVIRK